MRGTGLPLATVVFVCSMAAFCQERGLSILGHVRDFATQEPLSATSVQLKGGSSYLRTESGPIGEFQFRGLTSGDYQLSVERDGYQSATVEVSLGMVSPPDVLVTLQKMAANGTPALRNPISAHELQVPPKARAAFDKGVALLTSSDPDYTRAIGQFQRAIKESPTYYEAYAEMSIAQFRVGDAQGAEESLRKSVELSESRYAKALALLAELRNSQDRFPEAEASARQAIAADELSARAHCQLARALSGLKRPAEAEASAKRALELEPSNPLISLVLGNVHLQQRNLAAAVNDFNLYLSRVPNGAQSDLVRRTRDQAERLLQSRVAGTVPGP